MGAIKNTYYMNLGFAALAFLTSIFVTNAKLPHVLRTEVITDDIEAAPQVSKLLNSERTT